MTIYYIDTLGECAIDVDGNNIQFCNGECYFSDGEKEYRIAISQLIEIVNN